MRLRGKNELRKKEIENHFNKILKNAKTFKQINAYYQRVIDYLIPSFLENSMGGYNYQGFEFKQEDLCLITLIGKEHSQKLKIIESLK